MSEIYFPGKSEAENAKFSVMLEEIKAHLRYVLREKFGDHEILNPEVAWGASHVVVRFERGDQKLLFRVPQHSQNQHRRTMLAYRHAGFLEIMPEKIYHDDQCVIERFVEGQALTPQVEDDMIVMLAHKLSSLHAISASGFGPLDFDRQGMFEDALSYYGQRPPIELDRSDMDLSMDEATELTHALQRANQVPPELASAAPRLGHGDLWRNNILIGGDRLFVVDWDRIGAYPIEYDLIFMADADFSSRQTALFLLNYQHDVNMKLLHWFALRRILINSKNRSAKKLQKIREHSLLSDELFA